MYPFTGTYNRTCSSLKCIKVFDNFQISAADYNATKTSVGLSGYRQRIYDRILIMWNETTYSDLRKPLYSAIAFELSAILKSPNIPIMVDEQASLWAAGSSESTSEYIKAIEAMEMGRIYVIVHSVLIVKLYGTMSMFPIIFYIHVFLV